MTKPERVTTSQAILSKAQQQRVAELIELHHQALVVEMLGERAVKKSMLKKIKQRGLYRKPRADMLKRAFQLGLESVTSPDVLKLDAKQFDKYIAKKGDLIPTSTAMTMRALRESFAEHMKSLGQVMQDRVAETLDKANKTAEKILEDKQRRELFTELARRKALSKIAKDMGDTTRILANNASRTITTETNNAYQNARALEIIKKSGQPDPKVFKQPRQDACDECKKAYLKGDGKTPRVFRLSDLVANGTNIGKSKADRQPVLDSHHPWCACEVFWLPPGYDFDSNGDMKYVGRNT